MQYYLTTLFLILTLISCNESEAPKIEVENDPILRSMEKHADSLLLDAKITSLAIGIYKDGKAYTGYYGELDEGKKNKPSENTIYEIASVGKTFAGTLVSQAVLDGKLSLDDNITKYFEEDYPNLNYDGNPIKVRHLITHTSRIAQFLPDTLNTMLTNIDENLPFEFYAIRKQYDKQQFFKDLHTVVIDTLPGTRYGYSNTATELVAHILEEVYNKDYEEILREYILEVAEMPNTKIRLSEKEKKHLANGYGETRKQVPHLANTLWGAAGGLKSTLPDLINYMKFQLDSQNKVVQNSHQVIYSDGDSSIGYFWPVDKDETDGTYYGHHGGTFGTQNWLFIMPKHNLGFSIITNQSDQRTAGKLVATTNKILDEIR